MALSDQDIERLRLVAESDPYVKKNLHMYEQLRAFGVEVQDENDRRWRVMVEAEGKMAESEKPKTMGAHRDLLERFEFRLLVPIPREKKGEAGHFGDFYEKYYSSGGSMVLMSEYEIKSAPTPKPRCDECNKLSTLRCMQCGENYSSRACQIKAWPLHKPVCKAVAAQRL